MANTYDANLVVDVLSNTAITSLGASLAPFAIFATDFSDQIGDRRTSIQVPLVTAASTILTNATDFEQSDATIGAANIVLSQYTSPFEVTNTDLQNGKRIEWLGKKMAASLQEKLKQVVNALITTAYTNTAVTVAQSSFAAANARTLWASIKSGKRYLVLDAVAYSQLLPTALTSFQTGPDGSIAGLNGFDKSFLDTMWTGVGVANTYGFACNENALAMAARAPSTSPEGSQMIAQSTIMLPIGIPIQVNLWFSTKTRSTWISYDVMFGAARGDITALTYVKSA